MDEWLDEANAIRAMVPNARFGLPDTSGSPEWYAAIVTRLLTLSDPPTIAALTHPLLHRRPSLNPGMTIDPHPLPQPARLSCSPTTSAPRRRAPLRRRT